MIALSDRSATKLAELISEKEAEGYVTHGHVILERKMMETYRQGQLTKISNQYVQFMYRPGQRNNNFLKS